MVFLFRITMKLALGVSYQGSNYYGWQKQSHSNNTVQYHVEKALSFVADEVVTLACAGRTDSGVHATGQVIHIETNANRQPHSWQMGTNSQLPRDIRIEWVAAVPADFHARFSARYRRYQYVIEDNSVGNAIFNGQVTAIREKLDSEAMHQAAQCLLGEQDFSSFRAAQCQSKTPFRHIDFIRVYRKGRFIIVDIQANAFLYHMVRNIVGSLLLIGKGKKPITWLSDVLSAKDRREAAATSIANGLYLIEVGYDSVYNLPLGGKQLPFT